MNDRERVLGEELPELEAEMLRDSGGEIEVANGEEPAGDAPGAGRARAIRI